MSTPLTIYLAGWIGICVLAVTMLIAERRSLESEFRAYLKFLSLPWKVISFALAFLFVTFAGRYTNDETWDFATGGGMSILTFATAPWAVGTAYRVLTGKRPVRFLFVAMALLLFSSNWYYDAYLLMRDGAYSRRWLGNLMLSPIIYT